MDQTILSDNYSVCLKEDGSFREIGRTGPVVTYKAVGYESGKSVALQTIPLTGIDPEARARLEERIAAVQKLDHVNIAKILDLGVEDDHIVFVSEYLQGDTADAWVVAHGRLAVDPVLRIAMQVVSALAAAAFHGLTHRAIEPSNLMIVPGIAPDGGWPLIKLINFGLAGLKLYSDKEQAGEIVPRISPQFASPEQLNGAKVDFRSEMFSLGSTMCFLLTGAVPLIAPRAGNIVGDRTLPPGTPVPRAVRAVLNRMLRNDPDARPQDPVTFQEELRLCLQKVERRTAFTHRFGPPVEPQAIRRTRRRAAPVILALAALLLALAAIAAFFLPTKLRAFVNRNRSLQSIGVPIGVPEQVADASAATVAEATPARSSIPSPAKPTAESVASDHPLTANTSEIPNHGFQSSAPGLAQATASPPSPAANEITSRPETTLRESPPPVVAQASQVPEPTSPSERTSASEPTPANPERIASNASASRSQAPAERPEALEETTDSAPLNSAESPTEPSTAAPAKPAPPEITEDSGESSKKAGAQSSRESKARLAKASGRSRRSRSGAGDERDRSLPPLRIGSQRAHLVGTTQNGSWILQLPSGNTVVTPPVPSIDEAPVISHRRVRRVRAEPQAPPSSQQPPVVVLPPDT